MCRAECQGAYQYRQAYSSFENLESPGAKRFQIVLEKSSEKKFFADAGKDEDRQEIFQKRGVFHQRMSLD